MTLEVLLGLLVRHALTTMGGGAIVQGLLAGDTVNQVVGCLTGILGVALSVKDKRAK